jgi:hypothetical protein
MRRFDHSVSSCVNDEKMSKVVFRSVFCIYLYAVERNIKRPVTFLCKRLKPYSVLGALAFNNKRTISASYAPLKRFGCLFCNRFQLVLRCLCSSHICNMNLPSTIQKNSAARSIKLTIYFSLNPLSYVLAKLLYS